ncbi:MAG: MBL fold metallo-hydrolase, partial [Nitrospira sp.]|nr:MBL fold metallo-hydrolase [Nitrospira sp.]
MAEHDTYSVEVLLDVNEVQDVDDRAESRTYLVIDRESRQAVIIDPVIENVERDLRLLKDFGLSLRYVVETHIHADHITGASLIKDATGAQIVYGAGAKDVVTGADAFLDDGEELRIGNTCLKALATPG